MRKHPLLVYLSVLGLISGGFIGAMKLVGEQGLFLAQFYMLGPAIAALVTRTWFYENRFRDAGLRLGSVRDWFLAYAASVGVTTLSFALFTALRAVRWDFSGQLFLKQLATQMSAAGENINDLPAGLTPEIMLILFVAGGLTVFNIVPGLLTGFGEEFGWRGLMFPQLLRFGLLNALVAGSAIWFVWHMPIMLVFPDQQQYTISEVAVNVSVLFAGAFFTFAYLAWIYLKTGSILVVSFAHIVMNNAARAGSYFVVVEDQTRANVGLTLAFGVVFAVLCATSQMSVFARGMAQRPEIANGATA